MIPKNRVVLGVMLLLALALAAGLLFVRTHTVLAPVPLALTAQDEIAIYQTVIHAIAPPSSQAGPLYILRATDDRAAQAGARTGSANAVTLSPAVQAGLSTALGNVVWIDDFNQVTRDPKNGALMDGGVVITLANITIQQEHKVHASARYFKTPMYGAGYVYTLDWANGAWSITETTQTFIS